MPSDLLTALKRYLSTRPPPRPACPEGNPAAVLVLVFPKDDGYYVHVQKRSRDLGRHAGEACFPGGTPKASDDGLLATALREAHEEEGILPGDVTILGRLNDTPTRTGYSVSVFVGTIPQPYGYTLNPREVEEVVDVPLSALQDPANRREEARWQDGAVVESYAFSYGPHIIYGATANIMREFLDIIDRVCRNGSV